MKELLIGMALIFLDVKVGIGPFTVDLLPDFVGYYLMLPGLENLGRQSGSFRKLRPLAQAMIAVSAVLFVMEATAETLRSHVWIFCLGIGVLAVELVLARRVVAGVREMERIQNRDLEGEKLRNFWLYMAVIRVITYACGWLPLVGNISTVAALVMNACFLAAFYRTVEAYGRNG